MDLTKVWVFYEIESREGIIFILVSYAQLIGTFYGFKISEDEVYSQGSWEPQNMQTKSFTLHTLATNRSGFGLGYD